MIDDNELKIQLKQVLNTRFSDTEIRDLSFDLQVDYDNLSGNNKADKVRELIQYFIHRNNLIKLVEAVVRRRGDITFAQNQGTPRPEMFSRDSTPISVSQQSTENNNEDWFVDKKRTTTPEQSTENNNEDWFVDKKRTTTPEQSTENNMGPWFVVSMVLLFVIVGLLIALFPSENYIPFPDKDKPYELSSTYTWYSGDRAQNAYILTEDSSSIVLLADGATDYWPPIATAPQIGYPVQGDFEATIRLRMYPIGSTQTAGIALKSSNANNTFLRITLGLDGSDDDVRFISVDGMNQGNAIHLNSHRLNNQVYANNEVWFRVSRDKEVINLSYSRDGTEWILITGNYTLPLPQQTELVLSASSQQQQGRAIAYFHHFTLLTGSKEQRSK